MPHEKPQLKKFESKEEAYVFEQFHRVDFQIEKIPALYERLVELNSMPDSHFEDAVGMAKIVDYLWDEIKGEKDIKFTKDKLKLACLFHDIGKSGPAMASHRQRYLIETLFNPTLFSPKSEKFQGKKPRKMTIFEALETENMPEKEEIKEYLKALTVHIYDPKLKKAKEEKIDLQKHKMIDLWREHDYWTRDLLKDHIDDQLDESVAKVASTHHALDGHDPWNIDGFISDESVAIELIDKYLILTLVDKYQAWVDRSGLNHHEAIEKIKKEITESKEAKIINHEGRVYDKFIKYLDIIGKHPEMTEIIKKK
jgi:CRISPR/Cas system-associated endonuclease Cas3-HD